MTSTNHLEGVSLAGVYSLQKLLGESENTIFFRASHLPSGQVALVKLIPAESVQPEAQLELWRCVSRLSHPHLLPLIDFGQTDTETGSFLYAVFEYPDDTLDNASLSPAEARQVLTAALDALRYIHAQGLVHTAVDTGHVVAAGSQIKLASDTLSEPSRTATTAEDVRALGLLLYRLLTGRKAQPGSPLDLSSVPAEMRGIIENTTSHNPSRRWSPSQISEALQAKPAQVPTPPISAEPEPAPTDRPRSVPLWAYAGLVPILALLGFFFLPKSPPPSTPLPVSTPAPVSAPAPAPVKPVVVPEAPAVQPPPSAAEYWRVIAFTYAGRAAAEKQAQSINRKWPAAKAEVFSPKGGNRPPFLVALGGRMTRDEAVRFLRMARGKGFPRDTYIQNYR